MHILQLSSNPKFFGYQSVVRRALYECPASDRTPKRYQIPPPPGQPTVRRGWCRRCPRRDPAVGGKGVPRSGSIRTLVLTPSTHSHIIHRPRPHQNGRDETTQRTRGRVGDENLGDEAQRSRTGRLARPPGPRPAAAAAAVAAPVEIARGRAGWNAW